MRFNRQIALITGGSSGIGLAVARLLVSKGAQVWLLARQADRLQSALIELESRRFSDQQRCGVLAADVTDQDTTQTAIHQLVNQVGVPDLVICSAGITHPGEIQGLDLLVYRQLMEVNYFGTLNVIQSVLPGMLERGSGHIINISSVAGFMGVYGYSAYCASKFALRGYTDTLRSEMKEHGIRVSIVFPADTDTPQLEYEAGLRPPTTRELVKLGTPLSAEYVAREIVHGIEKKKYLILPGFDAKLFYFGSSILNAGLYPLMDYLVLRAKRQSRRASL